MWHLEPRHHVASSFRCICDFMILTLVFSQDSKKFYWYAKQGVYIYRVLLNISYTSMHTHTYTAVSILKKRFKIIIIYSPSCCFKPVWLSFFFVTQNEKFWKLFWSLFLCNYKEVGLKLQKEVLWCFLYHFLSLKAPVPINCSWSISRSYLMYQYIIFRSILIWCKVGHLHHDFCFNGSHFLMSKLITF